MPQPEVRSDVSGRGCADLFFICINCSGIPWRRKNSSQSLSVGGGLHGATLVAFQVDVLVENHDLDSLVFGIIACFPIASQAGLSNFWLRYNA